MLIRPDAAYKFRLLVESLSRRGHSKRVCKILQHDDDTYFLVYQDEQLAVAQATVAGLLNLLKNIDLSKPPAPSGGFDGTDYKVTIGSHFNAVTFSWWTDQVDKNWQPLIELRERIYRICAENFSAFSVEN